MALYNVRGSTISVAVQLPLQSILTQVRILRLNIGSMVSVRVRLRFMVRFRFKVRLTIMVKFG